MTREELRNSFEAYYHGNRRGGLAFAAVFVFCLIAAIGLARRGARGDVVMWRLAVLTVVATVIGSIVAATILAKRRSRAQGLTCPNCHKMLVGMPSPIAIASGRCCYCGHALISDV